MAAPPLTPLRIDDLAKALRVSEHAAVECHIAYHPTGGNESLRLDTTALKTRGLQLDIVVDGCPKGSRVSKGGARKLAAYLTHFVPEHGEMAAPGLGTLIELILECVKTFLKAERPTAPAREADAQTPSKPLFF
jgi:hypothetical protein